MLGFWGCWVLLLWVLGVAATGAGCCCYGCWVLLGVLLLWVPGLLGCCWGCCQ